MSRAESEVKNVEFEALRFEEAYDVVIPEKFPPKLKGRGSFSIPCTVCQARIDRVLYDLGTSVSLILYFIFQKLGLGKLQPIPISLQFEDGSMKCPSGILENVPINV